MRMNERWSESARRGWEQDIIELESHQKYVEDGPHDEEADIGSLCLHLVQVVL